MHLLRSRVVFAAFLIAAAWSSGCSSSSSGNGGSSTGSSSGSSSGGSSGSSSGGSGSGSSSSSGSSGSSSGGSGSSSGGSSSSGSGGPCNPVALAQTYIGVGSLLLGSNLYWADDSSQIFTIPTSGGSPSAIETGLDTPRTVLTDGTNLFTTEAGNTFQIVRFSPSGGTPSNVMPLSQSFSGWTIAGGKVYQTTSTDPQGNEGDGQVLVANPDGSGQATLASKLNFPLWPAGDGTALYFFQNVTGSSYQLYELSPSGGTPTALGNTTAQQASGPISFAGNSVYIVYGSTLAQVDKTSGALTPLTFTNAKFNANYVIDGSDVYFKGNGTSTLYKAPLAGGAATEFCSGAVDSNADSVALFADSTSIYVANGSPGVTQPTHIYKIAK